MFSSTSYVNQPKLFVSEMPEPWENELIHNQELLKRLKSQLTTRRNPNKRIRIMGRITSCEARILAITLANS